MTAVTLTTFVMEDIDPYRQDKPSWTSWLKQELTSVIQCETAKLLPLFDKQHSNFRAINGLPICFYCKRLGHVKKYCRKRNSNYEAKSIAHENLVTNRKALSEPRDRTTTELIKGAMNEETITQRGSLSKSGNAVGVLSKVGQLFRDLQSIASELHEAIESAYRNQEPLSEKIGDFETNLFNGEMQTVVQRVAKIVNTINSPRRKIRTEVDFGITEASAPTSSYATPSATQNYKSFPWTNMSNFGIT